MIILKCLVKFNITKVQFIKFRVVKKFKVKVILAQ